MLRSYLVTTTPAQVCEKTELTADALFEDDPAAIAVYSEEFLLLERAAVGCSKQHWVSHKYIMHTYEHAMYQVG